ncbi:MAG TPA: hypothetical protein VFF09_02805 [archaeon]|nr:hypothetical protein [archaeon]
MKIIFFGFFFLIIVFLAGCTAPKSNECSIDSDCVYLDNSCPQGPELCFPRWGAFCVEGTCELSHNPLSPRAQQWLETCDEHKERGLVGQHVIEECYLNSAYASLKKSEYKDYNIVWDDAFQICNQYTANPESCKLLVCSNLHLGDGNLKYVYPEQEQCEAEAIH